MAEESYHSVSLGQESADCVCQWERPANRHCQASHGSDGNPRRRLSNGSAGM